MAARDTQHIRVRGARQNNLKGISFDLPLGEVTAVTGVSGSGKSSLAFDTLYAEGQRRYVESFSAYARQFLDRMDRPRVDRIESMPPAIAIDHAHKVRSSRSTVGTLTEINDYLKLLFPRLGVLHCRSCGKEVRRESPETIFRELLREWEGEGAVICFPLKVSAAARERTVRGLVRLGYHRIYRRGAIEDVGEARSRRFFRGTVSVIADRLRIEGRKRARIVSSLEQALRHGAGLLSVYGPSGEEKRFSSRLHCARCDITYPDPSPAIFSFNNPIGACPVCHGFGRIIDIDMDAVIPEPERSIEEGAIKPFNSPAYKEGYYDTMDFCARAGIPADVPFSSLSQADRTRIIEGEGDYYGIRGFFRWLEGKRYKMHIRVLLSRYRSYVTCTRCGGKRIREEGLLYRIGGLTIADIWDLPIGKARDFFEAIAVREESDRASCVLIDEMRGRLRYLVEVGLDYLTLSRQSRTLSGGETQRVNLTSALGSNLVNTLYILDEPSIGLHPRDSRRLVEILRGLKRRGNTVVVVEHDPEIIRRSDNVLDLGPGSGGRGGEIVYLGPSARILTHRASLTGRYLSGRMRIEVPRERRPIDPRNVLSVRGASAHNLKAIDIDIPLGVMVCVTGVSGSGKSSLVEEVIYRGLKKMRGNGAEKPGRCESMRLPESVREIVMVDQSPIGKTPRANPATYMGAFSAIRSLFASTAEARRRGVSAGYFSFNVAGGRCEYCRGQGFEKVEMQFLADVFVKCPECGGTRFSRDAREITYRKKNIVDVLRMTVSEAIRFFSGGRAVRSRLEPLERVGLGYLTLGQPINTLSGGEAQRLKLARRMAGSERGGLLFIFDEPTTGLHYDDIRSLVLTMRELVKRGNSLIIIEHNMELVKCADYVIDLGPEGGEDGGRLVACGEPERIARSSSSRTARFLRKAVAGKGLAAPLSLPKPTLRAPKGRGVINISGAREHNLKNISVSIPHGRLVIITGPSGSGKSTLAFDIVFAEGERRYIESLSAYARQYLAPLSKPDAEKISGIPPTIAVEQRLAAGGRRSTVATATEIYHYMRLLYAKIGVQHCPECGVKIEPQSPERISASILRKYRGDSVVFLSPVVRGRKGMYKSLLKAGEEMGYPGVRIDGELYRYGGSNPPPASLERYREHEIDFMIGNIEVGRERHAEILRLVEKGLLVGRGSLYVCPEKAGASFYSSARSCPSCGRGFDELDPRLFSFNSPRGACALCGGLGILERFCEKLIVPDENISLAEGALAPCVDRRLRSSGIPGCREIARQAGTSAETPFRDIPPATKRRILYGDNGKFEGVIPYCEKVFKGSDDAAVVEYLSQFRREFPCGGCGGARLNRGALSVLVWGRSIADCAKMSVEDALGYFGSLKLKAREQEIAEDIVKEIARRLAFLKEVGLGYLTLERRGDTLSGGEAQRVRLAAQLGSSICGACYILDEPTIGVHPRDHRAILRAIEKLRDRGNTIIVVEHDEETIRRADYIIDLGPAGGARGGEIVASGGLDRICRARRSLTARWLNSAERRRIQSPKRNTDAAPSLELAGVRENNLRDISVRIPVGSFVCVTGVSGAGKSSLVTDTLLPAMKRSLHGWRGRVGTHSRLIGAEHFDRVLEVDSAPIGRTPRSTPATYVGFWDGIRGIFSLSPEARMRGYGKSRFSFNRREGQCPRCRGSGRIRVEMSFLPDVFVGCESCGGARYNGATLEVTYRDKTIADVLNMTVDEAADLFSAFPKVRRPLEVMRDIGLGYLTLGQPSNTLSGGEAQRIKIAYELAKPSRGKTLYVLEEPTIGLHMADIQNLLAVLQRLVEAGSTVVVVEHDLDVIKEADYIVDLGPGGGPDGGRVVFQGPLEKFLSAAKGSYTARWLRRQLRQGTGRRGTEARMPKFIHN